MSAKSTHDVTATIGEYKDAAGETKKRYLTVGKVFTQDDGRMSIKLDCVPVGPDWSGWLSLFPADKDRQRPAPASKQPPERQRHEAAKANAFQPQPEEDDIPF